MSTRDTQPLAFLSSLEFFSLAIIQKIMDVSNSVLECLLSIASAFKARAQLGRTPRSCDTEIRRNERGGQKQFVFEVTNRAPSGIRLIESNFTSVFFASLFALLLRRRWEAEANAHAESAKHRAGRIASSNSALGQQRHEQQERDRREVAPALAEPITDEPAGRSSFPQHQLHHLTTSPDSGGRVVSRRTRRGRTLAWPWFGTKGSAVHLP